jgi:hypothetical protein
MLESRVTGPQSVWLNFTDGLPGEVDLSLALTGPVFEPLRDPARLVAALSLEPTVRTIAWPNRAHC